MFMLMLTLREPPQITATALGRALAQDPAAATIDIASSGGSGEPIILKGDAGPLTLIPFAQPMPPGTLAAALNGNPWSDAPRAASASRAHVIISAMRAETTIAAKVASARAVTAVAGAVARLTSDAAVYVPSAELFYPASLLASAVGGEALPVHLWTRLHFGRPGAATSSLACWTSGVAHFAEREIEFVSGVTASAAVAETVMGVAYLALSGATLKAGDTVSAEGAASMVQLAAPSAGRLQNKPAYHLADVGKA